MKTQSRTFIRLYAGIQSRTYHVWDVWNLTTFDQRYEVDLNGAFLFAATSMDEIESYMKSVCAKKVEL